jgi:hypothetical protein
MEEAFREALWREEVGANTSRLVVPRLELDPAAAKVAEERKAHEAFHSARGQLQGAAQAIVGGQGDQALPPQVQCQSARRGDTDASQALSTPRGRINCKLPIVQTHDDNAHRFLESEPYKNHQRNRIHMLAGSGDCEGWKEQVQAVQQERERTVPQVDSITRVYQHQLMHEDYEKHRLHGFQGPPGNGAEEKNVIYFVGREARDLAGASKCSVVNFRSNPHTPTRPNPILVGPGEEALDKMRARGKKTFGRRMHVPSSPDGPLSAKNLSNDELLRIPLMTSEPKKEYVNGKNVLKPLSIRRFSEFLIGPDV